MNTYEPDALSVKYENMGYSSEDAYILAQNELERSFSLRSLHSASVSYCVQKGNFNVDIEVPEAFQAFMPV